MRGGLGLDDTRIVAAGNPSKSVLLFRMAKLGMGHMPQIGATSIDAHGVALIAQWISSIEADHEDRNSLDALRAVSASDVSDEARKAAVNALLATPEKALNFHSQSRTTPSSQGLNKKSFRKPANVVGWSKNFLSRLHPGDANPAIGYKF